MSCDILHRPHDGGTFFAGAIYIELPPGYREVTAEGHCTEQCTEHMLQKTIKIAAITPHMHYMGEYSAILILTGLSYCLISPLQGDSMARHNQSGQPRSLSRDRKRSSTTENNRVDNKTKVGMPWCRGRI